MSEYDPLYHYLKNINDKDKIILTLEEIERILGKKLPHKAYFEIQRWENSESHVQARAWMKAGWKVQHPSEVIESGKVTFIKQLSYSEVGLFNKNKEQTEENKQEYKVAYSIPYGSLICMLLIPFIPMIIAVYYYLQGEREKSRIFRNITLIGGGIGLVLYILTRVF
jgi:hypothetical protein